MYVSFVYDQTPLLVRDHTFTLFLGPFPYLENYLRNTFLKNDDSMKIFFSYDKLPSTQKSISQFYHITFNRDCPKKSPIIDMLLRFFSILYSKWVSKLDQTALQNKIICKWYHYFTGDQNLSIKHFKNMQF